MSAKTRRCITVMYPNRPGVTIDSDYYLKQHATLFARLYGASIAKLELRFRASMSNAPRIGP